MTAWRRRTFHLLLIFFFSTDRRRYLHHSWRNQALADAIPPIQLPKGKQEQDGDHSTCKTQPAERPVPTFPLPLTSSDILSTFPRTIWPNPFHEPRKQTCQMLRMHNLITLKEAKRCLGAHLSVIKGKKWLPRASPNKQASFGFHSIYLSIFFPPLHPDPLFFSAFLANRSFHLLSSWWKRSWWGQGWDSSTQWFVLHWFFHCRDSSVDATQSWVHRSAPFQTTHVTLLRVSGYY